MTPGPTLVTERLILRPQQAEDFEPLARMYGEAETMRHIGGPKSRSEAWRLLTSFAGCWTIDGFGMFSMIEKSSGRWIGRTGPWRPDGWPVKEVGWAVLAEFAGMGLAHEAAVASIDWAFDHLGWDEVNHIIAPTNTRSIALAERLGSQYRGTTRMPEPFHEMEVGYYGQTKAEWHARHR